MPSSLRMAKKLIGRCEQVGLAVHGVLEILMDVFRIAIRAFDPAMLRRDLQPDTRMAQATLPTIARHAILLNDLGFRCGTCHGWPVC